MRIFLLASMILIGTYVANAQRLAIIQPHTDGQVEGFASSIRAQLAKRFRILDDSLADAAYRSVGLADPFNLSAADARRIGNVVGSSKYILLRSAVQRRASIGKPPYFEGYAFAYVVSSRSGGLEGWVTERVEASTAELASEKLTERSQFMAERIEAAIKADQIAIVKDTKFIEVPEKNSPFFKGLRTPVPYRRLRPDYTELASSYGVRATIDIEVDVDSDGSIKRISIERWAGFGLDESVEKAVRSMNWRPAEREGKPLPMRILLRYNFTKIEKDEAN